MNRCARQIGAALGIAATVAAVGPAPTAPVGNFHSAWIACAMFTAAASIAALGLPRGGPGAVKRPRHQLAAVLTSLSPVGGPEAVG